MADTQEDLFPAFIRRNWITLSFTAIVLTSISRTIWDANAIIGLVVLMIAAACCGPVLCMFLYDLHKEIKYK